MLSPQPNIHMPAGELALLQGLLLKVSILPALLRAAGIVHSQLQPAAGVKTDTTGPSLYSDDSFVCTAVRLQEVPVASQAPLPAAFGQALL